MELAIWWPFYFYHSRMWAGNVFGHVRLSICPSVCLSVCPSMCLSVQTITFELLHIGASYLVWRYILTISRSSLSIKVIGSRSRSCAKKWLFTYFNLLFLCMYLQAINKVKVTCQGQGHPSRSRSNQGQHQIRVIFIGEIFLRGWFAFESNAFLLISVPHWGKTKFNSPI